MSDDEFYIPPIQITPAGADANAQAATLQLVEPSPGYPACTQLLVEAIQRESFTTVLDYTPRTVTVRFRIDGIWHSGAPMERERGDFLLATLKKIAGLDYRERRARQEGSFTTLYQKTKQKVRVVSQGVKTGERVAIYLDWKRPPMETLEQLGMRASMQKQLAGILADSDLGLLLVTALPGEGFTAAWRGVLSHCDRLTRDYFVIEEKNEVEPEVINVFSIEFDRSKGETAMTPVPGLLLKQPDVLAFNQLPDADTINAVTQLSINQNMPVFVRAPGKGAIDSILRLMVLKPDVTAMIERLNAVVAMRLVRTLCEKCRIAFVPHPTLLGKLGLPPGRVAQLYKPFIFKPGMLDEREKEIEPCRKCFGIGYRGRTGFFELLVMNDSLRAALRSKPQLEHVTSVAQQQGHITLQQEGIVLVARGLTSIEELQRVLNV